MGTTSPDVIRFPSDYGAPADVPNDMQNLANDVQTALNKKAAVLPTNVGVTMAPNWAPLGGAVLVDRFGPFCIARGFIARTANLTVADNTEYHLGNVPAGYRPKQRLRASAAWCVRATDGSLPALFVACQVIVDTDGSLDFTASQAGVMSTVDSWVSIGGIAWIGA